MVAKIRLLIADDHKMVREGLKAFLAPMENFEIVGEAVDGQEAVALARRLRPDIILLDLVMPNLDGIEATRAIHQTNQDVRILIITSFNEEDKVIAAIRAGAAGYMEKDVSPDTLKNVLLDIYRGGSALPEHINDRMAAIQSSGVSAPPEERLPLTDREIEILKLVASGLTNQEIAGQLFISAWTVRTHITHILNKLNLSSRTQAALYALRIGLAALDR